MKSKHFYAIINKHRKTLIIVLTFLIGVISIYPAFHLIPIAYNVISTRLSRTIDGSEPDHFSKNRSQREDQNNHFFLPIIQSSDQEPIKTVTDNELNTKLREIDTSPTGERITIIIDLKEEKKPSGSEVTISFLPGEQCYFGDGRACMYDYELPHNTRLILAAVHSGHGGEGDSFRNMVEGTGINQGLFPSDQVLKNIIALIGSDVLISQGETDISGLILKAIIRIPSAYIDTYLSLPIDQSFAFAQTITGIDLESNKNDLFVLETCGWRLPDETHFSSYPNSMQSIYLGVFSFDE